MVVMDFPGPKGQAVARDGVRKFCSTAEMLSWWLQPENRILQLRLYVHDMGRSHWDQPDDAYLVDATQAWYVTGTGLDRKSTRLNSSHVRISYAVFCLKKKNKQ